MPPGRKRPTQVDVARLANVSQATVSYVLNETASFSAPEDTRQRILSAIDTLGYLPNRRARSLRTQKTCTIATIIPDITNPFYPAFERGAQEEVEAQGYDLVLYNTDGVAEKEEKALRSALQAQVDGIVGVFFHLGAGDLSQALDRNVAVTRLENRIHRSGPSQLDSLCVDNEAAAHSAVSYLLQKGHRRIGMIAGHGGPRQPRIAGYLRALGEWGIPGDEHLIVGGEFTEQGGHSGIRPLLEVDPRPTAVFCSNDLIAMGALQRLHECRLHVPGDVAIMGFDDIPVARLVTPPLTTVNQFGWQLGQRCAEMVLERLNNTVPEGARCEASPFELIVRGSA